MNRYKLTASESASNAEKERAFKNAWFQVAAMHEYLLEVWDKEIRERTKLYPNVSSFSIHGSEHDFYENANSENHFYLKISFRLGDLSIDPNPPSYNITLNVGEVLTLTKTALQNIIFNQAQQARSNHKPKDPDYDRNFGKIMPKANRVYSPIPKATTKEMDYLRAMADDESDDWLK